jgi:di/tricarboxylate transporter
VEPVILFSKGEEIRGDFSDHEIISGDTFIVYSIWQRIGALKASTDFIVATPFVSDPKDSSKAWIGGLCFLAVIGLALAGFPIALVFLSGAVAMVLARVLSIQEAYQAVEWKVVFLLAGLIPLGIAMQRTGTAAFLAGNIMQLVMDQSPFLLVVMVGVLSTAFSLLMTNVGAIVMLAPLVIEMATLYGLDPRPLTLMAAVCAANSFLIPTHQVNALLMSPGGYRNADYLKAGSGMTLIFLVIVILFFYHFMI